MNNQAYIGIDLGGTNIKCILIDQNGKILDKRHTKTNDFSEAEQNRIYWKKNIKAIIKDFAVHVNQSSLPVGIATPGLTDFDHTSISYMPGRLLGIENLDWRTLLEIDQLWVINDANAALLAEHLWGAGQGKKDLVLLTLGTGVGGAIMVNGKLVKGWLHRAGHFGHITLDLDGEHGIVGLPGTLESLVGDTTIKKRTKGKFSNTYALIQAYRSQDPFAKAIWMQTIHHLAIGLCNIINILSPELIILSGGITKANMDLFDPLHTFMDKYEWKPGGQKTPIVKAQFVPFAGAAGAAGFAMQKLNVST